MLLVDRARRRPEIGRALLADAELRGATTLEFFRNNQAARRFYKSQGWRGIHDYSRQFDGVECALVAHQKPRARLT